MNSSTARTVREDFMALTARTVVGAWRITDAPVPAVMAERGYAGGLCR
jgi:hypothetical protein